MSVKDVINLSECSEKMKIIINNLYKDYELLYKTYAGNNWKINMSNLIKQLAINNKKDAIIFLVNNYGVTQKMLFRPLVLSKNTELIKYFIGYNKDLITESIITDNLDLFKWLEMISIKLDYNLLSIKAVDNNSIDIISYLISQNVIPAATYIDLIIRSAKLGLLEMMKILLNKYKNINMSWVASIAVKNNRNNILEYIVENYRLNDVEDIVKHAIANKNNEALLILSG